MAIALMGSKVRLVTRRADAGNSRLGESSYEMRLQSGPSSEITNRLEMESSMAESNTIINPDQPPAPTPFKRSLRLRFFLYLSGFVLAACTVSVSLALWWTRGPWIPVMATVDETQIELERIGKPVWSLFADFHYEVGEQTYSSRDRVLHRDEYEEAEQSQSDWPRGKTFEIYYRAGSPNESSLIADGNREASVVTAILVSTTILPALFLFPLLWWYKQARDRHSAIG